MDPVQQNSQDQQMVTPDVGQTAPQPVFPAEVIAPTTRSFKKKKWFMPLVIAVCVLVVGGAGAYVTVFQKSPEQLLNSALNNTSKGMKSYLQNSVGNSDDAMKLEGSLDINTPVAIEGSMKGVAKGSSMSMSADISAPGVDAGLEFRSIAENEGDTPNLYAKVSGIAEYASFLGGADLGNTIEAIDGKWIVFDPSALTQKLLEEGGSASTGTTLAITPEEMQKITDQMMVVFDKRLFTTDTQNSVFSIVEKVGKEDFEGTSTQRLRVKIEKDRFKSFVVELKDALKGTKIEEIITQGDKDVTLEEALSFDNILEGIEGSNYDKAYADVWVEANGRYVRNVRFFENGDSLSKNYFDIGMDYKGGDELPLYLKITNDSSDTPGTFKLGFTLNQKKSDVKMTMDVDMGGSVGLEGSMEMSLKTTDEDITIEKPEGAVDIMDLIGSVSGDDSLMHSEQMLLDDLGSLDDTEL